MPGCTKNSLLPLHLLKRHPISMEAHFEFVLVLTYAFPKSVLIPLLPPGLVLDCFEDFGFLAIAFVQTRGMRPRHLPSFLGQDFFLAGHRIFVRYQTHAGRNLRGLRILRSDADRANMVFFGNLLTHYAYHLCRAKVTRTSDKLDLVIKSDDGRSDVQLTADLSTTPPDYLPDGSPFATIRDALKFAGPLPFTFDYEEETSSIVRIEGVRQNWHPRSVKVDVQRAAFIEQEPFRSNNPKLCSAFYHEDVPYYWKQGIAEQVREESHQAHETAEEGAFDECE